MTDDNPEDTESGGSAVASDADNLDANDNPGKADSEPKPAREIGGRDGPDPTRYGDWEKNGRCIDF
jgi:hypothetical protein